MVEYIPIDDSEIEPEAPLVSSLGVRWRDNPVAIARGAPGAPRIQTDAYGPGSVDQAAIGESAVDQAAIGASAVGQSELKTATGTVSSDFVNDTWSLLGSLPGGSWGLQVESRQLDSEPEFVFSVGRTTTNDGFSARGAARRIDGLSGRESVEMRQRYIQSSPPYDHGDGEVQGYDYASLDADGRVVSMYLAEDPPWYGNTQHTPIAQWRDKETGKEYQRTRKLKCCKKDVDEGRISMAEFIERAGECEDVVEEITPEVKLRGMDELPHPFEEREGRTIVLLDPMDEKISRLIRMMQAGEYVHELFREGYLIMDNEPCKRCGPPGVPIHGVKWRKT